MRVFAVALVACTNVACAAGPVTSVTVRDASFQVVKVLSPTEIAEFENQWNEKSEVEVALREAGGAHFKLDVERKEFGGRWLYYTTGLVSLLAHNKQPVYKVQNPAGFNKLIGAEK